jgi:hypothetical protein
MFPEKMAFPKTNPLMTKNKSTPVKKKFNKVLPLVIN